MPDSYDNLLQSIATWSTAPEQSPYDFNGVVHLMNAALDNLRRNALVAELDDIGNSLTDAQKNFLYAIAFRCGFDEVLQACANDAINIFLREVLIPNGIVDLDRYDEMESRVKQMQSRTCKRSSELWRDAKLNVDK